MVIVLGTRLAFSLHARRPDHRNPIERWNGRNALPFARFNAFLRDRRSETRAEVVVDFRGRTGEAFQVRSHRNAALGRRGRITIIT